ncbi:MAG: tetratricopeptide repeat protein [Gammaproteobacteria bacterium]
MTETPKPSAPPQTPPPSGSTPPSGAAPPPGSTPPAGSTPPPAGSIPPPGSTPPPGSKPPLGTAPPPASSLKVMATPKKEEEKPKEEKKEEEDELVMDVPPSFLKRMATEAAEAFMKRWKVITAVLVIGFGGYGGYFWAYTSILFNAGIEQIEAKNYGGAAEYLERYREISGKDEESSLLLARAYFFAQQHDQISAIFPDYDGSDVEVEYMLAIAEYPTAPKAAHRRMVGVVATNDERNELAHIVYAPGVLALLEGDYTSAARHLSESLKPEDDRHLRALFEFFLKHNSLKIQGALPFPFDYLPTELPKSVKVLSETRFAPEGYNNFFSIPLNAADLAYDVTQTPATEAFQSLYLLAQTQADPKTVLDTISAFQVVRPNLVSPLAHYISGYYHAAGGDYEKAAEIYAAANKIAKTSRTYQHLGAALWMVEGGAHPTTPVTEAYKEAITLDPSNSTALNNYSFLQFYLGNIDEAQAANAKALSLSNTDIFAILNRLLVGLATDNLDADAAVIQIDSLLAEYPDSPLVLGMAAQIQVLRKNVFTALPYLQKLENILPEDPGIPRRIADGHRHAGQLLLAAEEINRALEKFPENSDLIHDVIVYYARSGNDKTVRGMIRDAGLEEEGLTASHAEMVVLGDKSKSIKQATALGEQALAATTEDRQTDIAVELARLYLREDEVEKAKQVYDSASSHLESAYFLGAAAVVKALGLRIRAAEGDAAAETEILALLDETVQSENVFAQVDLCWGLVALGKFKIAIDRLEKIRVQPVQMAEVLIALRAAYKADQNSEKVARLDTQIKAARQGAEEKPAVSFPSSIQKIFTSRSSLLGSINDAIAAQDYERVIELYTDLIESKTLAVEKPAKNFQNRGAIYIALERYDEAVKDFSKALSMGDQLSPEEKDSVHYNYVNTLVHANNYKLAVSEIDKRLDQPGRFKYKGPYRQLLALALSRDGQYKRAKEEYGALIYEDPRNIKNYIKLAETARLDDTDQQAIEALTEGLEIDPQNLKMRKMLYDIYNSLGQTRNAQRQREFIERLQQEQRTQEAAQ